MKSTTQIQITSKLFAAIVTGAVSTILVLGGVASAPALFGQSDSSGVIWDVAQASGDPRDDDGGVIWD